MKVEIIIDDSYNETLVKIYSNEYNTEIEELKNNILKKSKDVINVFKDDEVYIINNEEIVRAYAQNKTVYIETIKDLYKTKLKIYELDERLNKSKFIKISRSEIINLKYVKRLDLSFIGTIAVELKNGKVSYVSRRSLKDFKKEIGL